VTAGWTACVWVVLAKGLLPFTIFIRYEHVVESATKTVAIVLAIVVACTLVDAHLITPFVVWCHTTIVPLGALGRNPVIYDQIGFGQHDAHPPSSIGARWHGHLQGSLPKESRIV